MRSLRETELEIEKTKGQFGNSTFFPIYFAVQIWTFMEDSLVILQIIVVNLQNYNNMRFWNVVYFGKNEKTSRG